MLRSLWTFAVIIHISTTSHCADQGRSSQRLRQLNDQVVEQQKQLDHLSQKLNSKQAHYALRNNQTPSLSHFL